MSIEPTIRRYTLAEEIFNSVTHGVGALLSLAGLTILVILARSSGNFLSLVSFLIYGITLLVLYLSSTLYHGVSKTEIKETLRILDHSSIYLLIAGSYTPITLLALRGTLGWSLFGIVWLLALIGIGLNLAGLEKTKKIGMALYFLMGWLVVLATRPLLQAAPTGLLILMLVGGLFYTVGILFYAIKKIPFNHGIWHLFVLAGSISHFLGYLLYLT